MIFLYTIRYCCTLMYFKFKFCYNDFYTNIIYCLESLQLFVYYI